LAALLLLSELAQPRMLSIRARPKAFELSSRAGRSPAGAVGVLQVTSNRVDLMSM
jgi:hypothetical protein